jgi:transcription antitermination factor NusB
MGRRLAREMSLKIMYRYEEGDTDIEAIERSFFAGKKYSAGDIEFCRNLVQKTIANKPEIDERIIEVLKNWTFDRIQLIDKIILRLGTCEILFFAEIPPQVTINEAIEIGKKYGSSDSGKFINGILDAIKINHESSDNK